MTLDPLNSSVQFWKHFIGVNTEQESYLWKAPPTTSGMLYTADHTTNFHPTPLQKSNDVLCLSALQAATWWMWAYRFASPANLQEPGCVLSGVSRSSMQTNIRHLGHTKAPEVFLHGWGFTATQSTLSLWRGSRLRGEQLAFPAARGTACLLQGAGKAALARPEPVAVARDIGLFAAWGSHYQEFTVFNINYLITFRIPCWIMKEERSAANLYFQCHHFSGKATKKTTNKHGGSQTGNRQGRHTRQSMSCAKFKFSELSSCFMKFLGITEGFLAVTSTQYVLHLVFQRSGNAQGRVKAICMNTDQRWSKPLRAVHREGNTWACTRKSACPSLPSSP